MAEQGSYRTSLSTTCPLLTPGPLLFGMQNEEISLFIIIEIFFFPGFYSFTQQKQHRLQLLPPAFPAEPKAEPLDTADLCGQIYSCKKCVVDCEPEQEGQGGAVSIRPKRKVSWISGPS